MGRASSKKSSPISFVRNRSDALVTNNFLNLYPKAALKQAMVADEQVADRMWMVLKALTSNDIISGGRTYGGGLHKAEPKEIAALPVSLPDDIADVVFEPVQTDCPLFS